MDKQNSNKSPPSQRMLRLRKQWADGKKTGGVVKRETGIRGLDEVLQGGLPQGRATLVVADAGCGKTVLLNEFLYRGATLFDEPGIFLTFEERPEDIVRNLRNFDWAMDELLDSGQLMFLDASPPSSQETRIGAANWLEPALARIRYLVEQTGAKRLAVDNLGTVLQRFGSNADEERNTRELLFRFADGIRDLELTTLISSESRDSRSSLATYGVGEFVCDGLIELNNAPEAQTQRRNLLVRKMRGCAYRSGRVQFEISPRGMEVYPKVPVDTRVGETDFSRRETMGISALDQALGGGIPQGHIMLVAGNTGTGKSTLGLHFAQAGLEQDQSVIWVALEEPIQQVLKTAQAHDWNLQPYVDNGRLCFVSAELLDIVPDKLLYQIIDAANETGARRIVIDSVSSLESATMSAEAVREFMMQLAGYAKVYGITVMMNYLSGETFGAGHGQLLGSMMTNSMRLSSIVDGVILLRYVERDQGVQKLLNILKLRGSQHVKDILRYEIDRGGLTLGRRFGIND